MAGHNLIGRKIKKIRTEKGLTQKEFAKKIGSTIPAVSNWENGRNLPNKERSKRIAEIERMTVHELLNGKEKVIQKNMTSILVNLYQIATAEDIVDGETNKPITVKKYQKMIKDEVLDLSNLLGIKIER